MTPEQMQKEAQAAMRRMADRLVESGFANGNLLDTNRGIGRIDWTASGIVLSDAMKKIFKVPKTRLHEIPGIEIIALTHLLLGTKPVQDTVE